MYPAPRRAPTLFDAFDLLGRAFLAPIRGGDVCAPLRGRDFHGCHTLRHNVGIMLLALLRGRHFGSDLRGEVDLVDLLLFLRGECAALVPGRTDLLGPVRSAAITIIGQIEASRPVSPDMERLQVVAVLDGPRGEQHDARHVSLPETPLDPGHAV